MKDENQRNWLNTLLDKDNRAGFKEFMETNCISLVDLLTNELSSAEIPLSDFLHIVPYIQPRFYTISSSSSVYPSSIHITIGIMQQNTPNGKDFVGLCSAQCSVCVLFLLPSYIYVTHLMSYVLCLCVCGV